MNEPHPIRIQRLGAPCCGFVGVVTPNNEPLNCLYARYILSAPQTLTFYEKKA